MENFNSFETKNTVNSAKKWKIATIILAVLFVVSAAGAGIFFAKNNDEQKSVADLQSSLKTANEKIEKLGAIPVKTPENTVATEVKTPSLQEQLEAAYKTAGGVVDNSKYNYSAKMPTTKNESVQTIPVNQIGILTGELKNPTNTPKDQIHLYFYRNDSSSPWYLLIGNITSHQAVDTCMDLSQYTLNIRNAMLDTKCMKNNSGSGATDEWGYITFGDWLKASNID